MRTRNAAISIILISARRHRSEARTSPNQRASNPKPWPCHLAPREAHAHLDHTDQQSADVHYEDIASTLSHTGIVITRRDTEALDVYSGVHVRTSVSDQHENDAHTCVKVLRRSRLRRKTPTLQSAWAYMVSMSC